MKKLALLFVGLVVLMGVAPVLADDQGQTAGRSVREFVTPEGRFDLEAARRSGYQGSLDMRGVESAIDPVTGQPLFRTSGTKQTADDPDDIYWDNMSPSLSSFDGPVLCMTFYAGNLIVGGKFTAVGGVSTNCIAAWDGYSWSPLGSGVNDTVLALTVYDNKLIVGGYFKIMAEEWEAHHIAAWDGSSWSSVGYYGMDYYVSALAVYDGKLIAGGDLTWRILSLSSESPPGTVLPGHTSPGG